MLRALMVVTLGAPGKSRSPMVPMIETDGPSKRWPTAGRVPRQGDVDEPIETGGDEAACCRW
jgi:hypothetical protein